MKKTMDILSVAKGDDAATGATAEGRESDTPKAGESAKPTSELKKEFLKSMKIQRKEFQRIIRMLKDRKEDNAGEPNRRFSIPGVSQTEGSNRDMGSPAPSNSETFIRIYKRPEKGLTDKEIVEEYRQIESEEQMQLLSYVGGDSRNIATQKAAVRLYRWAYEKGREDGFEAVERELLFHTIEEKDCHGRDGACNYCSEGWQAVKRARREGK